MCYYKDVNSKEYNKKINSVGCFVVVVVLGVEMLHKSVGVISVWQGEDSSKKQKTTDDEVIGHTLCLWHPKQDNQISSLPVKPLCSNVTLLTDTRGKLDENYTWVFNINEAFFALLLRKRSDSLRLTLLECWQQLSVFCNNQIWL